MKNETTIGAITVGGQPSSDEVADGRFATVVNLRLPDEDGNQTADYLAGTDTTYVAVPWTASTVTFEDVDRIADAVESTPGGSVLIH